jgi:predicted pyridoxine 5'-phosphate oxidase superfamily flavin-nucleotide-binding protein
MADTTEVFHEGERTLQEAFGVRDDLERIGRSNIRSFMPDQHRLFFGQLPFKVAGIVGSGGRIWASILAGMEGFVASPEPNLLTIAAWPGAGDPLAEGLGEGDGIGLLGIELHTRRRNRANGRVAAPIPGQGFGVRLDQSFGNCPQYIWPRKPGGEGAAVPVVEPMSETTGLAERLARADTMFIASVHAGEAGVASSGVDVSHRGGRPGFMRLEPDGSIVWPEYKGNFLFNTLGNIVLDGRAGLLIPDFQTGDALQLSGLAEVLPPEPTALDGVQVQIARVRFQPRSSSWRAGLLPGGWSVTGQAASAAWKL